MTKKSSEFFRDELEKFHGILGFKSKKSHKENKMISVEMCSELIFRKACSAQDHILTQLVIGATGVYLSKYWGKTKILG